jgi:hypothetical protein
MSDDKIINIRDLKDTHIPEIMNRSGSITLNYGIEDKDTIEIEGSITISEACFMHKLLGKYLDEMIECLDE